MAEHIFLTTSCHTVSTKTKKNKQKKQPKKQSYFREICHWLPCPLPLPPPNTPKAKDSSTQYTLNRTCQPENDEKHTEVYIVVDLCSVLIVDSEQKFTLNVPTDP